MRGRGRAGGGALSSVTRTCTELNKFQELRLTLWFTTKCRASLEGAARLGGQVVMLSLRGRKGRDGRGKKQVSGICGDVYATLAGS